jgi:hypothetical protein
MTSKNIVIEELQQLQNAVQDMTHLDYQSVQSHFLTLDHILRHGELAAVTSELTTPIDLDTWLKDGHATAGSYAGSASLSWPLKVEERISLSAKLIEKIAAQEVDLNEFVLTFFYTDKFSVSLQKMFTKIIVPFLRDYRHHVVKSFGLSMTEAAVSQQHVSQQFNFHNTQVGSVQTGNNLVANVQMSAATSELAALADALEGVMQALAKVSEIPGHDKDDIVDLIEDSKNEIRKEKLNKTKLNSYFAGIAGAIGTVANIKPAYELLVVAAAAAGFTLPSV